MNRLCCTVCLSVAWNSTSVLHNVDSCHFRNEFDFIAPSVNMVTNFCSVFLTESNTVINLILISICTPVFFPIGQKAPIRQLQEQNLNGKSKRHPDGDQICAQIEVHVDTEQHHGKFFNRQFRLF